MYVYTIVAQIFNTFLINLGFFPLFKLNHLWDIVCPSCPIIMIWNAISITRFIFFAREVLSVGLHWNWAIIRYTEFFLFHDCYSVNCYSVNNYSKNVKMQKWLKNSKFDYTIVNSSIEFLSWSYITFAFYILGFFISLSLIAFLIEIFIANIRRYKMHSHKFN